MQIQDSYFLAANFLLYRLIFLIIGKLHRELILFFYITNHFHEKKDENFHQIIIHIC